MPQSHGHKLYLLAPAIRVPIDAVEGPRLTRWYRAQQDLRRQVLTAWMCERGVDLREPDPTQHSPHFGLLALGAWLERAGYEVAYLDEEWLDARGRWEAAFATMLSEAAGVFVGGITVHYDHVRALIREVKQRSGAVVVAGGHHATYRECDAIEAGADLVVRGEGELAVEAVAAEIVSGRRRWCAVPGASFVAKGRLVRNPEHHLGSLDDTPPFPYHLLDEEQRATLDLYVFPSRGCRYACIFCAEGRYWGGHRMHSPEVICQFIEAHQRATPFNVVYLYDSSFGEDRERTLAFCRLFAARFPDTYLRILTRLDLIDREMLEAMEQARVIEVLVGIESADEVVRARSGKPLANADLYDRLKELGRVVPLVKSSWMVGLPGETCVSARATATMMADMHARGLVVEASCRVATYYPGTPCFEHPERFGLCFATSDWSRFHRRCSPAYDLDTMTSDEIYTCYCEAMQAETDAMEQRIEERR
jgi:radical SAM superfamily enzyme YgiQ (UPF0313 family)